LSRNWLLNIISNTIIVTIVLAQVNIQNSNIKEAQKYKLVGADVILIPIKYYFNLNLNAIPSEEKNAWANSYLI